MANKLIKFFNITGLTWFVPLVKIAAGENPAQQMRQLFLVMGVPFIAFAMFLGLWSVSASGVKTSLGAIPGPAAVWGEVGGLIEEHVSEQTKKAEFYQRQEQRNKDKLAEDPHAEIKIRPYTGKPTYFDKILTSLRTVFAGFVIATLIAVPLGILCGMSPVINTAFNPLIQIFKPVSPLAWLPIVTLVVSAAYVTSEDSWFEKSFITSAITVTLCSLWPTLINTAVGVSSIDRDLVNVGKVLRLDWPTQIKRIILPSALPFIFTGMRLSLGVGWMVLIAAEMLAQNPGLGKFVWDEFQNGSSNSLSRIMVAVFTIGIIGFALDRIMHSLQNLFSFQKA
ncbi:MULTISPECIES: ABC transporter permease [Methylomonas]|uniref:ABC transporter permease n=1 Tax=Methylomonas TaxID=416 RepID=UPI0006D12F9E|nr:MULTISPECIES: ABC transporter permease [Methylomonas]ANE55554.1 nitrate ABC transporter permease [Methylomonas sp. DH-1]WNB77986.1 ABC transporter permease [Methylomonas koyamae]BBL58596.1 nitrate transporter [Methylomonas koyamae]